jgi:hypothetical protein
LHRNGAFCASSLAPRLMLYCVEGFSFAASGVGCRSTGAGFVPPLAVTIRASRAALLGGRMVTAGDCSRAQGIPRLLADSLATVTADPPLSTLCAPSGRVPLVPVVSRIGAGGKGAVDLPRLSLLRAGMMLARPLPAQPVPRLRDTRVTYPPETSMRLGSGRQHALSFWQRGLAFHASIAILDRPC